MQKKNFTYTIFLFCSLLPTSSATMEKQLCKSPSVTIRDNAYVGMTPFIPIEHKPYIVKPYVCDQCGKSFSSSSNLNTHKYIHTDEQSYECMQCNKKFNQYSNLISHEKRHTAEKPHACDTCNKRFFQKTELRKHKNIHTLEKKFWCDRCDKKFHQKINLTIHMRIHTGERPYACDQCNQSFAQKINLTRHIQSHLHIKSPVIEKNFVNFEFLLNNNTLPINNEHNIDDAAFLQWIEQ
jgi:uncharacterized Zn-finger protein